VTNLGRAFELGGALILLGLLAICISYLVSPSRSTQPSDAGPDLVASGSGELAPIGPTWKASDLAYDRIDTSSGSAVAVPAAGITSLAELAKQVENSPAAPATSPPTPPASTIGPLPPTPTTTPATPTPPAP
jgi:hypothetical protein